MHVDLKSGNVGDGKGTHTLLTAILGNRLLARLNAARQAGQVTLTGGLGPDDIVEASVRVPAGGIEAAIAAFNRVQGNDTTEQGKQSVDEPGSSERKFTFSVPTTNEAGQPIRVEKQANVLLAQVASELSKLIGLPLKIVQEMLLEETRVIESSIREKDYMAIAERVLASDGFDEKRIGDDLFMLANARLEVERFGRNNPFGENLQMLEERHGSLELLARKVVDEVRKEYKRKQDVRLLDLAKRLENNYEELARKLKFVRSQVVGDSEKKDDASPGLIKRTQIAEAAASLLHSIQTSIKEKTPLTQSHQAAITKIVGWANEAGIRIPIEQEPFYKRVEKLSSYEPAVLIPWFRDLYGAISKPVEEPPVVSGGGM